MDDFERNLRVGLRELAEEVAAHDDLEAEVGRRVRRRTVGRRTGIGLVAAAALVAAVVAVPRVVDDGDEAQRVVADTPSPDATRRPGQPGNPWRKLAASPLAGRHGHVAVWTGREMLIWGGARDIDGDYRAFADGAAYDPVADAWRPMADSPLSPREEAVAVWTGSELVVWGGIDQGLRVDAEVNPGWRDGARYDPLSDSWRRMAPAPSAAPAGRAAVWTGSEVIIHGGIAGDDVARVPDMAYNPSADNWRPLPPSPLSPRSNEVVAWTGREMIVWGGQGGAPEAYVINADGAAYDPATDRWRALAPSPLSPRSSALSTWAPRAGSGTGPNGELLVWGGTWGERSGSDGAPFDGAAYDPVADSWRRLPKVPGPGFTSWGAALVWTGGVAVAWGGGGGGGGEEPAGFRYVPDDLVDSVPPAPIAGRARPAGVWSGEEAIFWGGGDADVGVSADGAAYRPAAVEPAWPPPCAGEFAADEEGVRAFVAAVFAQFAMGPSVDECVVAGAHLLDEPLHGPWRVEAVEAIDASSWDVTVSVSDTMELHVFVGPGQTASGRQAPLLVRGLETS